MIIQSFDIHTEAIDTYVNVKIWTKKGSHVGSETNVPAWSLICDAEVVGAGPFEHTAIPQEAVKQVHANAHQ